MKHAYILIIGALLIANNTFADKNPSLNKLKGESDETQSNVPFFKGQLLTEEPIAKKKSTVPTEQKRTELTKKMRGNGMHFTPNKGQLSDMDGKLCPDVLYKGDGSGADVYLRKTGISYVYTNMEEVMHEVHEQVEELIKGGLLTEAEEHKKEKELMEKEKIKMHRVDMDFLNCNKNISTINEDELDGYQNFYYAHCPNGVTNVKQYNKVTYKNIYNNIDIAYYGSTEQGIKYDLIVQAHADPNQIKLQWKGAEELTLENGKLKIKTSVNEFYESIPKVYQNINGKIIDVKAQYILSLGERQGEAQVSFKLGAYNSNFPLVIDPWATYYGGTKLEYSKSIATDNAGNVVITGYTLSANFPKTAGAFQPIYGGGAVGLVPDMSRGDAFVVKFDSAGVRQWATFYGGSSGEFSNGVSTDNANNVLITGRTASVNFPILTLAGGYSQAYAGNVDAFVVKFDPTGMRLWATLYGDAATDHGGSIATDNSNNVVITGGTQSINFPITGGAAQSVYGGGPSDAFVVKFTPTGARLWATFYGGSDDENWDWADGHLPCAIATDNADNVIITGVTKSADFLTTVGAIQTVYGGSNDAFIVKFDPAGAGLWATFYGGSFEDYGNAIAVDNADNILITGLTKGGFPVTAGAFQTIFGGVDDPFLVKFNSAGIPIWATYYGGGDSEWGWGIATDGDNYIYLLMEAEDVATPSLVDPCAYQSVFNGGDLSGAQPEDQVIVKFTSAGLKTCATYMGGTGEDDLDFGGGIAIYGNTLYITGTTDGGYPVTTGAFQTTMGGWIDAFVASLCTHICEVKALGLNYTANTTSVCANTPITFTPSVDNSCDTSGYKFQWTFPGGIPSSSDSVTPTVTYSLSGTYDVKLVLTTVCKKDSLTKVSYITVNSDPIISVSPSAICAGGASTLTATGGTSYVWSTTETTSAITVSPTITTSYSLTATTSGCSATASATVIVGATVVPVITGDTIICNGSSTTLTSAGGTYLWSTGETTSAITVSPSTTSTYSVTVTSGSCSGSVSQTVTVNPIPTPTITGTTTICSGDNTTLTASGGETYSWSTTAITTAITVSPTMNTTYTVTANSLGCTGATTIAVTVNPLPTPNITGTTAICTGSNTILTATGGGTYEWSTTATTTAITISPTTTTTYTVTATDLGCSGATTVVVTVNTIPTPSITGITTICTGSNTTLTATGGGTYEWSTTETTTAIIVSPTTTTTYTVTATDLGCSGATTVVVTVNTIPTPSITGITTICTGSNTTLTATGGGTYEWSTTATTTAIIVSPTTNTTYTVTATDLGCSEATTVAITVNSNPTPSITGATTICIGNSTTLTATGGARITWSTNETTTAITVSPTNTTTYTVTVDNAGCTGTTTVAVSVVSPPTAIAAGTTVCEGETINLTSSGGGTYSWNGPNSFTSGLQNPLITNSTIVNSGTYTVTVSNVSCSATATAMVTVNPTPNTNSGSDINITIGSSTTLTATGGTSYIWTPTSGLDCDTCASVIATPTSTTIYCVQTSIGTCNSSDCVTVTVETPCPSNKDLAVPNAFSPNADGHNDDFCLEGWNTCIETFIVLIYDRWGEKVFESEEVDFCWDGMYRGKIMDPAVFVYYIKARFTNGEQVVKKGNVSLIK